MLRSIWFFGCLLIVWGSHPGVGMAQETGPLRVQTQRLQRDQAAERQALAANDSLKLAEAYYQYGRTYIFAGNYRASQGYFLKALRILEPRGDSEALSRIYVRLSENEDRLDRYGDAVRYANQALTIARRTESLLALGRAYGVMARVRENRWDAQARSSRAAYDSILYYHQQEEIAYRTLNDTLGMAEASLELGTLLTKVKNPRAIPYLKKALHLIALLRRDRMKVNVLLHLSTAYLTFGQRPLAFQTLRTAEQLYVKNGVDEYDTVLGLEQGYVRYYRSVGGWQQAFAHQERANALVMNQLRSDREATIARLNVEYETGKKEALLKAQQGQLSLRIENLRTQQRFTLAMSALFVVATGMSLVFFRLYRKNRRISRRNEALVKEQNHRVKNNLQVVSSLLSLQSNRLTDETARQAVEESRLRVQSMVILHRRLYDGDRLAEVDADEFIRELVAGVLRAYGFTAVQTHFTVEDISLSADKSVPMGLIINELITNACKYAFPNHANPQLRIDCHRQNHKVALRIADNGPGLDGPGLDGPGLDGPGRTEVRLERSDGSGSGRTGARLESREKVGLMREPADPLSAVPNRSFGMQLIQAQVEQLYGTYRFSADGGNVFTMEFYV